MCLEVLFGKSTAVDYQIEVLVPSNLSCFLLIGLFGWSRFTVRKILEKSEVKFCSINGNAFLDRFAYCSELVMLVTFQMQPGCVNATKPCFGKVHFLWSLSSLCYQYHSMCAQCMVVYCTIRNILSGFNTGIMNGYIGIF